MRLIAQYYIRTRGSDASPASYTLMNLADNRDDFPRVETATALALPGSFLVAVQVSSLRIFESARAQVFVLAQDSERLFVDELDGVLLAFAVMVAPVRGTPEPPGLGLDGPNGQRKRVTVTLGREGAELAGLRFDLVGDEQLVKVGVAQSDVDRLAVRADVDQLDKPVGLTFPAGCVGVEVRPVGPGVNGTHTFLEDLPLATLELVHGVEILARFGVSEADEYLSVFRLFEQRYQLGYLIDRSRQENWTCRLSSIVIAIPNGTLTASS